MAYSILLIDEDGEQRRVVSNVLSMKSGYEVVESATPENAINYLLNPDARRPDIVLLDLSKSGFMCEAVERIKDIQPNVPIVVLLKYSDYDNATRALRAGASDFLNKPIPIERLELTLRNTIVLRDAKQKSEGQIERFVYSDAKTRAFPSAHLPYFLIAPDGNVRPMEELEEETINFAMQYYNGRMTEVAKRLGIGRSTLYRKLNDIELKKSMHSSEMV